MEPITWFLKRNRDWLLHLVNTNSEPPSTVTEKPPITNCHTHIFTGDHVPPRLGRTFLPMLSYYLFTVKFIVRFSRWWYQSKLRKRIAIIKRSKLLSAMFYISWFFKRFWWADFLANVFGLWMSIHAFLYIFETISSLIEQDAGKEQVVFITTWLNGLGLIVNVENGWLKLLIVVSVLLFYSTGRNLILFVLKKFWQFLNMLPGKQTINYFKRYLTLGRFAIYKDQDDIYSRLNKQYPPKTRFVVLPMDMEFMGAGAPPLSYEDQMRDLIRLKENHPDTVYPFVFVDPRRMDDTAFFDYEVEDGSVVLKDCLVKQYIETNNFAGFKIYPALGYYPFDANLLPLWRYAEQNDLPIMTHCIIGTIFYRGRKLFEWNKHPIFEEPFHDEPESADENRKPKFRPLALNELKNVEFQRNFTHPLNYLCLLDDDQLLKVLFKLRDDKKTRKKFEKMKNAFLGEDGRLEHSLHKLKICFGHFGGDDEWRLHFELDRHNFVHQLTQHPKMGIEFFETSGHPKPGKISQLWGKTVDWYSIICSMMLQYPNVYADISYIIHDPEIFPLLKQTLSPEFERLRSRVLFGTDFYVVRNHKSERAMLAEVQAALDIEEFDLIARFNPARYLQTKKHNTRYAIPQSDPGDHEK
jgi:predicted TIM-barrel fold metal-dependent hydrolase